MASAFLDLTAAEVEGVPFLKNTRTDTSVDMNDAKTVSLPTAKNILSLWATRIAVAPRDGVVVAGVPVRSDAFVETHAHATIIDKGAEDLARLLSRMPDKVAMMVVTKALSEKTPYFAWRVDACLSRIACKPGNDSRVTDV